MEIVIKNFNIRLFRQLLDQNLMVDNQVMIQFTPDIVRSCALTSTDSFMKMWSVPMSSLTVKNQPDANQIIDLDSDEETEPILVFNPFNIYVLKGDVFRRYLRVYGENPVTLKIDVDEQSGNGVYMTIIGETQAGSSLTSTFTLTKDEYITSKVNDFDAAARKLTPASNDISFILSSDEMKEIKTLIKELHKTTPSNTSYINFKTDVNSKMISVSDAVFDVKFPLVKTENYNLPQTNLDFNILKSDFIVSGGHTYTFYTSNDKDHAIMVTTFSFGIIGCVIQKAYKQGESHIDDVFDTGLEVQDLDDFMENF